MHEDRTIWICLEDSLEDGSEEIQGLPSFETRQGAINWMVDQTLTQHEGEANAAMLKALQAWISLAERSSMDGIDREVAMTEAAIAQATEEVS